MERMTAADLRLTQVAKVGQKRVMGAQRTTAHGIDFDSKREADRYCELLLLKAAGAIRNLRLQVPIQLLGRDGPILTDSGQKTRTYVADFKYFDVERDRWVVEDAKGHPTEVFKIKRAILAAQGIEVREV